MDERTRANGRLPHSTPDLESSAAYFEPAGPLARAIPGFEHRAEQVEMARQVERALTQNEVGLFEAGTGTGKSLAYLIPAALHAFQSEKPVVVSTYTLALQEQLIKKDIPIAQKIFPDLRAVLVKGWRNYICHQRLEAAMNDPADLFDAASDDELRRIAEWARTTTDGTRADLSFEPSAPVWDEVSAESDSCLRTECPHYGRCPFFRDRAAMAGAHLLVVNHHLLFSDVAVRRALGWGTDQAVLPDYEAVILDEAHHVEDVATEHLGASVSSLGVSQLLGRVHRRRRGRSLGLVPRLQRFLAEREEPLEDSAFEGLEEVVALSHRAEESVVRLLDQARRLASERAGEDGDERRRIGPGMADYWESELAPLTEEASEHLRRLVGRISSLHEAIRALEDGDALALTLRAQLDALRKRLSALAATLSHFTSLDTREYVYWLETARGAIERVRLGSAPIDVGPALLEWIEAQCQSLILVSATLAVRGSFDYIRDRLGLMGRDEIAGRLGIREALVSSPFSYRDQALLGVVTDLPSPTERRYGDELAKASASLIAASRGRALFLFTSFSLLDHVHARLRENDALSAFHFFAQGEAPRWRLLEAFRSSDHAVLLGTDSFWEGIDIPGEALSLVVLTRLPFDVPSEPVTKARAERVQLEGRSSFAEYLLPRAALKLKQGFGRLIRTREDRGAVVICDRRVSTRAYGRVFLESLPECRTVDGPYAVVASAVSRFL